MLQLIRATPVWLALLVATGCTGQPAPPAAPQAITAEAAYRLLFNDVMVGHTLFRLAIDADGRYRFESFTVPAGNLKAADDHEVFESSRGTIHAGQIVPQRYDHSVVRDGQTETVNLLFDWESRALRLVGGERSETVALLPETHDHLSYLLVARQLAAADEGERQIRVASPEGTEDTRLAVVRTTQIEIPGGSRSARVVRRDSPQPDESRSLWFADAVSPLPLRVEYQSAGNSVEMQLETLQQAPTQ